MDAMGNGKFVVWGPVVWDSGRGTPKEQSLSQVDPRNVNPNPNHQFTISWIIRKWKCQSESETLKIFSSNMFWDQTLLQI